MGKTERLKKPSKITIVSNMTPAEKVVVETHNSAIDLMTAYCEQEVREAKRKLLKQLHYSSCPHIDVDNMLKELTQQKEPHA